MKENSALSVAIIGAGPAGIAAGHELLAQGFKDFTIFEKESAAGGTWHMHSYPGLACDVWAHAYTFSYAPNPNFTENFVGFAEIAAYLQRCATEFGLDPHIKLNTRILSAKWQPEGHWLIQTDDGKENTFDVIINAMGNQHTPVIPQLEAMESFTGHSWHSTEWNHDIDLSGKNIVVVGSAAAAVQVVPELAKVAKQLTVLQRSPNWILPRGKKPYSQMKIRAFNRWPWLVRLLRWGQRKLMAIMHKGALLGAKQMDTFENMGRKYINKAIEDPALRAALTPSSRFGCKRPLVADDFYPALNQPNVDLVAEGAKGLYPTGIVTASGQQIEADVIIYCTGYRVMDFDRIEVVGKDERNMAEELAEAPEAYKGSAVPGYPNYFFAVGPNALVLSAPYFNSAEVNVAYIVNLLAEMRSQGTTSIEVKADICRAYNDDLQQKIPLFSWGSGECTTYYETASGHHPFLFPGNFKSYVTERENSSLQDYQTI
ncbi:MAG: NAD(P)/FAD-dependent oxidoreductase [Pseudomonadales bacterium]